MDPLNQLASALREAAGLLDNFADEDGIVATVGERGVVHVHADPAILGDRPHEVDLEWDFGDAGSARNVLPGFNAAHAYAAPGQYHVRLVVRGAGALRVYHRLIDVRHAGQGILDGLPSDTVNDDVQIRLERGRVYEMDRTVEIAGRNVSIVAVGDGALPMPVLRWTGEGSAGIVRCLPTCRDVCIENIAFDGVGEHGDRRGLPIAVQAAGTNLALVGCRFDQVQDAVNANGKPTGLLMQNCTAGDDLHAYLLWAEGTDFVLLDNFATLSVVEHIVRVGGAQRMLCVGNDFTNGQKSCFNVQVAEYVWLEENRVHGPWAIGPLGDGDGRDPAQRCRFAVVRGNDADVAFKFKHGTEHARLEGNTLRVDDRAAIEIEGFSEKYARGVTDVQIVGNLAVNTSEHGSFLRLDGQASDVRVNRNCYVAPALRCGSHETAVLFVLDESLRAFTEIADNDWPDTQARNLPFAGDGTYYVWPIWSDMRGYVGEMQIPNPKSQ